MAAGLSVPQLTPLPIHGAEPSKEEEGDEMTEHILKSSPRRQVPAHLDHFC